MTDVDYEAIEAAVTETVRGRWFLAEFARRNRGAEVKVMLDAMGRLETLVTASHTPQAALPPPVSSDPSIRLLVQRIKEIAASLEAAARDMCAEGVAARFWEPVEGQARAVAGLMRTAAPPKSAIEAPPSDAASNGAPAATKPMVAPPLRRLPPAPEREADPRRQALSGLDDLSLPQKLALFT